MSNSLIVTDLDHLKGLESAKRMVVKLGRDEAPSHAVLFYGIAGSGKTSLANYLTNAWLCRNPDRAPCGECQPCVAFQRGAAVDVHPVEPGGRSDLIVLGHVVHVPKPKKEEEIYSIQEFFRTMPLSARNKVVVIEGMERMNSRAANALLKMLEEPPSRMKFVMTTDQPGALLPTIFSRCICINCSLPPLNPPADLEPELIESTGGSRGELKRVLESLTWHREWLALAKDVRKMDLRDALVASDRFRSLADKGPTDRVRQQTAQALEIFSTLFRGSSNAQEAIAEAHRLVLGNGNAGLAIDAMFAKILGEPGRANRP